MKDFYTAIDIFSLSSRYEGLSIAFLDALASGCQAVITDAPGNREMIRFGFNRIWYTNGNDVDDSVIKISLAVEFVKRGGSNNHAEIVRSELSSDVTYGRVLAQYHAAFSKVTKI